MRWLLFSIYINIHYPLKLGHTFPLNWMGKCVQSFVKPTLQWADIEQLREGWQRMYCFFTGFLFLQNYKTFDSFYLVNGDFLEPVLFSKLVTQEATQHKSFIGNGINVIRFILWGAWLTPSTMDQSKSTPNFMEIQTDVFQFSSLSVMSPQCFFTVALTDVVQCSHNQS